MHLEDGQVVLDVGDRVMGLHTGGVDYEEKDPWNIMGQEGTVVEVTRGGAGSLDDYIGAGSIDDYIINFDNDVGGWERERLGIKEGHGLYVEPNGVCYRGRQGQ